MKDNQRLPARDAPVARSQIQMGPPHRILVVDDDENTRRLNVAILTQAGYEVDAVTDGGAGFDAIRNEYYDLVITDNAMPKVTGIQMLKKLRAAHLSLPVIMATGALPTEEFARNPWLQPDASLLRPYSTDELLRKVAIVLQVADASERLRL
jgi:DNA-binding response OmpR family regulator